MEAYIKDLYEKLYGDYEFPPFVNERKFKEWAKEIIRTEIMDTIANAYEYSDGEYQLSGFALKEALIPFFSPVVDMDEGEVLGNIIYDIPPEVVKEVLMKLFLLSAVQKRRKSSMRKMVESDLYDRRVLRTVGKYV